MRGVTTLVLAIISLLLINIFTLVRFSKFKQQIAISKTVSFYQKNIERDELNTYKTNFTLAILNSNLQIDNVLMKDTLSNVIQLQELFENGQKQILVCRFSQTHCESCVSSSIQILRSWVDSVGINNVCFFGNHLNNTIFAKTISLYSIQKMNVYNVSAIHIPAEELGYPYFFVLDSSLRISNVFFPNKGLKNITNEYLKTIQKKFDDEKHIL